MTWFTREAVELAPVYKTTRQPYQPQMYMNDGRGHIVNVTHEINAVDLYKHRIDHSDTLLPEMLNDATSEWW